MASESVDRALRELEQLGLLERTGEFRNGQPVWVLTAHCRHLEETAPDVLDLILNQDLTTS